MKYLKLMWYTAVALTGLMFVGLTPLCAQSSRYPLDNHRNLRHILDNHRNPRHLLDNYRKKIVLFNEGRTWSDVRAYAREWRQRGVVTFMEIPIIDGLVMGVPERVSDAEMAADYRISSIESDLELSGNESLYGQGVSFIRPLTRSPFLDRQQHRYEAPWSVLKLFDQPYDDRFFSGVLQHDNIPDPVAFALKKLKMNSAPVAIFDTGMQAYHRYLWRIAESAVNVVEFVESDDIFKLKTETAFDDNGHGSHVAGIIGGILDPQHRWGAGANIDLYSVKVLGDDGMGFLSNIIYGLQWAIDNDIKIVNMSIAYRQDSPAVRRAIQESAKAGVIMLASAGNKSNYDPNITLKITADGGSADGGSADGGSADGGSA
ncbi:Subtilase family protein, partial [Desulfococcus multivorans DSM 2059]